MSMSPSSPQRGWSPIRTAVLAALAGGAAIIAACSGPAGRTDGDNQVHPAMMQPRKGDIAKPGAPRDPSDIIDLTSPAAVVRGTVPAVIENLAAIPAPVQITGPWTGPVVNVEEVLEGGDGDDDEHEHDRPRVPAGIPNTLPVGGINAGGVRPDVGAFFPGIGQTPWTPPDPTLAVGPNHVMATVNMAISWWTKAGVQQFSSNLDNTGNPGFFESVGCGNFTFDPKCFYDHYAGRWVVIAPETYGSTEAWICIAVSDDSDPNGTWFKYRTNAVVTVGGSTYWVDYPGFGYDQNAYYVNGNLFGLNTGGTAGTMYRVFNKAPLLTGQPAVFSTLRDPNIFSVQSAQAFGNPQAPFFVAVASSSSLRVQAITNPLTAPALVSTTVTVPTFGGTGSAPSAGGNSVGMIDGRIMNVHWRNGNLYAAHDSNVGGIAAARWYHMNTNNWPASGNVTLVQSGNVSPGGGKATFFPAIYSNQFGDVGMVVGASSANDRVSVNAVGRRASDPTGTMGPLTELHLSAANGGGRWGDYQDIAVDPSDDSTFWVIGEVAASGGWSTWIDKFTITTQPGPFATDDNIGNIFENNPATIDVLANDGHTTGQPIVISSFQGTSVHGGTITRSVGTGPGGRDQLVYNPPTGYVGPDTFTYTVQDPALLTDTATVTASVLNDSIFRDPENPGSTEPGLDVAYYTTSTNLSAVPNFSLLTPYLTTTVPDLNQAKSIGNLLNSTRADRVAARFVGFVEVPTTDDYTFYLEDDDGAIVYIGNQVFINHDGSHAFAEKTGTIGLKAGKHAIRVEYFENIGFLGLKLSYSSSTISRTIIPASAYFNLGPCPADFDGTGFVDLEDFNAFITAFEAGKNAADFDSSGFVDLEDYTAFVAAFEVGC